MLPALGLAAFAFGVSMMTLFTGFGLGTLLLPAFALILPVELAVASTAVVHGANNVFKVSMLASRARKDVLIRFGIPAVVAAFAGAGLLAILAVQEPLASYTFLGLRAEVTPIKLVLGGLILGFALFELIPRLRAMRAPPRFLPLGGALSGFFGGLSGHQGALRAAFLTPLGLTPHEFAATQSVLGLLVDLSRLLIYATAFFLFSRDGSMPAIPWSLVGIVTVGAVLGAYTGVRTLSKVTIGALHRLTGALLLIVGTALAAGLA